MPCRFVHCAIRSNTTAVMNSAIGKWINTTCCECLANSAVLGSKGFTITVPLLRFARRLLGDDPPSATSAAVSMLLQVPAVFCSISIGERGLSLFGLAIRWLRNHPQSVAIQDINEISLVLKPLDHSQELLHYSRSGWIRQIPKYKIISRGAAAHRENLAFGNDRHTTRQAHPARQGRIRPRDYSNRFWLSGLADIDNRDALVS